MRLALARALFVKVGQRLQATGKLLCTDHFCSHLSCFLMNLPITVRQLFILNDYKTDAEPPL